LQLAEDDPEVLFRAALVLGNQLLEDLDSAIVLADRALALNPGLAIAWSASGWQRLTAGQPDLAAEQFQTMERLDPLAHRSNYLLGMGVARFGQKRFSEAADLLRQARHLRPDSPNECIFLAACYGHLGQRDAGREAVARWEALTDTSVHDPVNWFANHSIIMPAIAIIEGTAPPDARAPV
jgi:tetratricopeptide (TPR) repeat protein